MATPEADRPNADDELVPPQEVHRVVREQILTGSLVAGSEISQVELCRRLHVSRTPLREALRQLEREGLVVENGRHRMVQISPLSMSDLDDIYSLRITGEALAIHLTVPFLRIDDFDRLGHELELTTSDDEAVRRAAHSRFHAGLRAGVGDRLIEHLARLFEQAERYQRAFGRQEADEIAAKLHEHTKILEACQARDSELARTLLVDHIAGTAVTLMTAERYAPFALTSAVTMAKAPITTRPTL